MSFVAQRCFPTEARKQELLLLYLGRLYVLHARREPTGDLAAFAKVP